MAKWSRELGHEFDFRFTSGCASLSDHVRHTERPSPDQATDRSPITDCQLSTDTWSERQSGERYSLLPWAWSEVYHHGRHWLPQPPPSICINSSRLSVTWQVVASICPPLLHDLLQLSLSVCTAGFFSNLLQQLTETEREVLWWRLWWGALKEGKKKSGADLLGVQVYKLHVHWVNRREDIGAALDDALSRLRHGHRCAGSQKDGLISTAQWQVTDKVALD